MLAATCYRYGLWLLMLGMLNAPLVAQSLTDYVNPFIGSSNFGATNPGAVVPQGMVSVTPFNVTGSKQNTFDKDARWWSMPFAWENDYFVGYSHVNLSGVGCPELGVIQLMPTTGDLTANHRAYGTQMTEQKAEAGYYRNLLPEYQIETEVTASERVGLSRFTFPGGKANILLNLGVGLTNEQGGSIRIVNEQEIEGHRMTGTFCYNDGTERPVYFVARFSRAADNYGVWKKMPAMQVEANWSATPDQFKYYEGYGAPVAGDSVGAWMSYEAEAGEQVLVKIGVSYVSIANARLNLDTEMPGFDFANTREKAQKKWEEALSAITVEGGTQEQKTVFYTALYHMHLHPNLLNDVNGEYPIMEGYQVGKSAYNRYTVFSLWDTYRNFHPFMSLVYPQKQLDMVRSMVDMYKESGWLPKWELNSTETHVMEGDPAIPAIVDSYVRGLRDFDVELAYEAMLKSATTIGAENKLRPDIDHYLHEGYVPLEAEFDNSVSHALEYYIADWNLGQFAKALGKEDDYQRFHQQSLRYKTYFDTEEYQVIRPKLPDGSFLTPFDPKQGENFEPSPGFHEGTAWQYTFYAPHDIPGLIELMGGEKKFTQTLQKVFDEKLFDMANEPDINYPYLFNYIEGEEWRAQKELHRLMATYYKNSPDGIPGNDDCGTLSAWIVFSMMGIYPVCPGNPDFALSSPVFDRVVIRLDSRYHTGSQFEIITYRDTAEEMYIKRMKLDGKKYRSYFLPHQQLIQGGTLEFYLQAKP
ncbi:MAG: GH92 family glycosyl hydrolase [Bacteroidota bacterium]